jgi:DNA-binding beta-propeller fold protein YncE
MKNKYFIALIVLVSILSFNFIVGCGSTASGGGGASGTSPWMYVANNTDKTISYVDLSTNTVIGSIEIGMTPYWLAASPDGKKLYCAVNSPEVVVIDTSSNTISEHISTTSVGTWDSQSYGMEVSNNGSLLYIARLYACDLIKISTGSTHTCTVVTSGFSQMPYRMILNSDSTKAYVGENNGISPSKLYFVTLSGGAKTSIDLPLDMAYDLTIKDNSIYAPIRNLPAKCVVISVTTEAITNYLSSEAASCAGIISVNNSSKLYVSDYDSAGKIRLISSSIVSFESTVISGDANFKDPSYMAQIADGKKVYVYDPGKSLYRIAIVDTSIDSIEGYIAVGNGSQGDTDPVIVYK